MKYTVQIVVEFPKEHSTYDAAEEQAEKVVKELQLKYGVRTRVEHHIWEA